MKRLFFILMAIIGFAITAKAQSAQSIYFELGGPGIAALNYDTRFTGREDGIGGRIGIGGISIDGEGLFYIPVGLNYLLGKEGSKHYFELGAGATPAFGSDGDGGNLTETFGHLLFGYRLQPPAGGFTFRAFISPIFGNGYFIPYWVGISLGYKF